MPVNPDVSGHETGGVRLRTLSEDNERELLCGD